MSSSGPPCFEDSTATKANSSEKPRASFCRFAIRNVWRVIKCIIFMTCVTFFTYQTTEIYKHYYTYPMRTNINVVKSEYFKMPAITICLRNLVNRTYFCGQYPHLCSQPNNLEGFCTKHPYMCKEGNASNLVIPMVGYYTKSSKDTTAQIKKILQELVRTTNETGFISTPSGLDEIYTLDEKGIIKYARCYSDNLHIFSKDNQTTRKFDSVYPNPRLLPVRMSQKKEEYLFPWYASQVFLLIHSPFEPAKPMEIGKQLMNGFKYDIDIKLEEEHLLPAPYATNCTDYETLWLQNNKTGPRSHKMCRELCRWNFTMMLFGCVYRSELISKLDNVCLEDNISSHNGEPSSLFLCYQSCKSDCQKLKYFYTVTESPIETYGNDLEVDRDSIELNFYVRDLDVTVISHVPLYGDWELFSSIGGLVGCWLGISVWALVGIGEKTLWKCFQYVMKLKKRTKETTAVSSDSKED